jgi:hypothetical protein
MWWNSEWPTALPFLAPAAMFLLMAICMVLMARMHRRHAGTDHMSHAGTSHAVMGCCGFGLGPWSARTQDSRHDLAAPPAGSTAFEEYRLDALRRLEHEENEFHSFLDRLRTAKDKSEFDQFMAERRGRAPPQYDPTPSSVPAKASD